MDPEDQERLEELAERETAYGLFQRAAALLKRRHHAQAAVLLERADKLEPRKGSIVEALARAYYNSGLNWSPSTNRLQSHQSAARQSPHENAIHVDVAEGPSQRK